MPSPTSPVARRLPLAGLRVIDLSMVWAGPACTRVLADMGAEVLKVEACQRLDHVRYQMLAENEPGERPWERGWWNGLNRNKLGVTLNLADPRGIALLKDLVRVADVLVENFSPRVMANLGLGYAELRTIRPDLVMISLSGFGQTGPYSNYAAYGHILEHMSGLSSITGYPDGAPTVVDSNIGDPASGLWAAGAVLSALIARIARGAGRYIDFSELEATENLLGDALLDYTVNGRVRSLDGNRHPAKAPHGVYPCSNGDRWVAVSVTADDEWRTLCPVIGQPDWAVDAHFASWADRKRHEDEIDAAVARWTRQHKHLDAMRLLQEAGVPAGAVLSPKENLKDAQHEARGFFQRIDLPQAGPRLLSGPLFRLPKTPASIRAPAPGLGQHNGYALRELLGLAPGDMQQLDADRVIGDAPYPNIPPVGVPIAVFQEAGLLDEVDPLYHQHLGIEPGSG